MNKKLLIPSIAAIIAIAAIGITANIQQGELSVNQIEYTPSDISKEITEYEIVRSSTSYVTTNIKNVKDKVKMTIEGTVISVGKPIKWDDTTINPEIKDSVPESVKIPIDIQVDKVKKVKDVKKGDIVTVFVFGDRVGNQLALEDGLNFETGEKVIVHIAQDRLPGQEESTNYVMLGQYGKYKIQDDVAFNAKYKDGKSIEEVLKETQ